MPVKKSPPSPTSLRIEPELKAALEKLAAADDRTLSNYILRILRDHVSRANGKTRSER
jgi:predicted transcriptional regulator